MAKKEVNKKALAGKLGGMATFLKHGSSHMAKLARKSQKVQRLKKISNCE